jgi:hypothetical protein
MFSETSSEGDLELWLVTYHDEDVRWGVSIRKFRGVRRGFGRVVP